MNATPTDKTPADTERTSNPDITRPAIPQTEMGRQTRIGAAWLAVAVGFVMMVLLLIFIVQNQQRVTVSYFAAHGGLPLGALLLFAAAGGALLVIVLGFARIAQLRWLARQDRRNSS